MAITPRIVTVDPTGSLARIVRTIISDLLDRSITLIDLSSGTDALALVKSMECAILVTTVELDDDIKGYQLAIESSKLSPETHVIVLAESTDPELDADELASDFPYVYMHRPVDLNQFARVINAALTGDDIFEAMAAPRQEAGAGLANLGPLPPLDGEAARPIIDTLLTDVGAMAVVFANRAGEVLLERGAVGYLDREQLTDALMPMFATTVDMGELVGGQTRTLHFYDGDEFDVFVISVGLHHFLCLIFNGEAGNRAFGSVNRFGRRAAEDLIALLGASAFVIQQQPQPVEEQPARKSKRRKQEEPVEEVFEPIERAEVPVPEEPEALHLEPISDLDLSIFDDLDSMDTSSADDLFDPSKLADLANEMDRKGGVIDGDQARELGIIPNLD